MIRTLEEESGSWKNISGSEENRDATTAWKNSKS